MSTDATLFDQAIALHERGEFVTAEQLYRQALEANAEDARSMQMLGVLAYQTGRIELALELLHHAIALNPLSPQGHSNLGVVLAAAGRKEQATAAYSRSIELDPNDFAAHLNLGLLLSDPDQLAHAAHLNPNDFTARFELANALVRAGQFSKATEHYNAALALNGNSPHAWSNLGTAQERLGDLPAAAEAYQRAIAIDPVFVDALYNLALVYRAMGQVPDALSMINKAITLRPDWPEALNTLGICLGDVGELDAAAEALRRCLAIAPNSAEAHCNLGNILRKCGKTTDAIASYRKAIALRPDDTLSMSNLGSLLSQSGESDEAIEILRRAIELNPTLNEAFNNLGNATKETGEIDAAIVCWHRVLQLRPDDAVAHSNLVYTLLYHPQASATDHRDAAVEWSTQHAQVVRFSEYRCGRDSGRRLRIGYVAPDFREHCQSLFTIALLSHHDRERFEVICYADVASPDAITQRIRGYADVWRSSVGLSDQALAERIHADGVDVLVDLTLHMSHNRLLTFARKPAPVQISWLGYPGTTGVDAIDYRLSDPWLDPPEASRDAFYTERTIRLPDTFWCYDPLTSTPLVNELPMIRNGWVTFGCLNNWCKANDATLRDWASVLRRVGRSRLLLLAPKGSARQRVLRLFEAEGIDAARIEFVGRQSRQRYLETYHRIDIGLDTFPYNGHTTSLDSYWMGVPVVTRFGESAVSRAGLSQLTNLGLTELVAADSHGFVDIAATLAADVGGLHTLRSSLRERLRASPLMDAPRFARAIESIYCAIARNAQ